MTLTVLISVILKPILSTHNADKPHQHAVKGKLSWDINIGLRNPKEEEQDDDKDIQTVKYPTTKSTTTT